MHPFEVFLEGFVPRAAKLLRQSSLLLWILETTGSADAADLKGEADTDYKLLFHDKATYQRLLEWEKDPTLTEPLLKRQLTVLLSEFKRHQIPEGLLRKIAEKESELSLTYAHFRPRCDGVLLTENEIRTVLKTERDPAKRQKVWEASKEIGALLAPKILELVTLRNQGAQAVGYADFFEMQLDLQGVDKEWLLDLFDDVAAQSDAAYTRALEEIRTAQEKFFGVKALGPWAWSEPFCQEDPLDNQQLDALVGGADFVEVSRQFFSKMGFDVDPILQKSDMHERPGKNQHAFCLNLDRKQDVRTLNNLHPTIKWLETVLHELGHAVYEVGYAEDLPWLLREPPHIFTTEAMALVCGRQAYRTRSLQQLIPGVESQRELLGKAERGLQRRQLIFSRWAMVMTGFEAELYRNPSQDLNRLWWELVQKFQKITPPGERTGHADWAAKYHIGMAPAYYFSYLLGELFASTLEQHLPQQEGFRSVQAGNYFKEKLFKPGSSLAWAELVTHSTGAPLSPAAWLKEFA